MCDCKQCQAAIMINELFHEMNAARFINGSLSGFPEWKIAEMKFLSYILTGDHA
jgi:hypothetical protein